MNIGIIRLLPNLRSALSGIVSDRVVSHGVRTTHLEPFEKCLTEVRLRLDIAGESNDEETVQRD